MARVLFPFSASTFGGSHASTLLLMRELPRLGFEPVAVVLDDGPMRDRLARAGIEQHCLDMPSFQSGQSLLSYLPVLMRIAVMSERVIRELNVQVLHINDSRMANTWILGARMAGCRIVLHQRTRFARSRFLEWNAAQAHAVIAISEYVKASLPQRLRALSEKIFNPFDEVFVSSEKPERGAMLAGLSADANTPVIAFFGTLSRQKRPDVFVRLAAMVRFTPPPVFLMFGRAEQQQRQCLTRLAEGLGLSGRFRIFGFADRISEAMAACDVVVAPAVDEGFGRVPVEAAFAGVPAVVAASGGHFESVVDGQTGVLIKPDDPSAFAAAIDQLLGDPERGRELASAARRRAIDLFSVANHAKSVSEIYRRVL